VNVFDIVCECVRHEPCHVGSLTVGTCGHVLDMSRATHLQTCRHAVGHDACHAPACAASASVWEKHKT